MTLLGAIIAGGAARRFGADKGAALLGGVALIDHVAAALRGSCAELVIVGREWPGLPTLTDRPHAGEGPLGGLNAALHHARARGHEAVLCAGCDSLPLPDDLAERLSPGPAVIDGHWLMGLWPTALAGDLDRWLTDQPDRSIRAWMRQTHARAAPLGTPIFNINTPEALVEAEAALAGR
ncbi:molybdenum cofactor guanylyltransferase [Sphingobium jiangsuense]|uniref:Molybdopterin-guanine dinucleotide biosynthesis protein A n=1 Tax=Sphingobium jiangsuense TaxID=870476 RepID=A0A7W6BJ47_9SPHN|nr:molybdenum cofactor guanylyltransferase [Sphingobium jiangsuense]MBB3924640.1 molybdopterin-guanine dinucleotide biosynthesis protein A [Sphingobium jiangsuense]GLT02761.1 molybdenum cofactor guanylyltransferase [Sphingobium jiangsuense]